MRLRHRVRLLERERSGKGQVVDTAMVDGAMNLFSFLASAVHANMWGPRGTNLLDTGAHFYEVYETSDGGYMSVGAIEPQFYAEWLDGLGMTHDEQFKKQHDASQWPELKERTAAIFKTKTRDEWDAIFATRDACTYPVLSPKEAPTHPYNAERKTHVEGGFGVLQPAPAPRFSRTPGAVTEPAPESGGHTSEVLKEAGYSDAEISKLLETGAAAQAQPQ